MRENTWFNDGDRGAHRPEDRQVRELVTRFVRKWTITLGALLLYAVAWFAAGEPPPPGPVEVIGLALLAGLGLAWPRSEALAGIAAVAVALSLRNTALQGPFALSMGWLVVGLFAAGSARRCRKLLVKHAVLPIDGSAGWVALAAAGFAAASTGLLLGDDQLQLIEPIIEGSWWTSALAIGVGIAGGSRDHPNRTLALISAALGGVVFSFLALLIVLAWFS